MTTIQMEDLMVSGNAHNALIADVGGVPAAAMSLADGRVVADPFKHTGLARVALAQRAKAHEAALRTPNLVERLILELRRGRRAPAMG